MFPWLSFPRSGRLGEQRSPSLEAAERRLPSLPSGARVLGAAPETAHLPAAMPLTFHPSRTTAHGSRASYLYLQGLSSETAKPRGRRTESTRTELLSY